MKIVIAPQGFKGNLSALQVAQAIARGLLRVIPETETVLVPMADGGEGTVQTLVDATGGKLRACQVTGPLESPDKVGMARWGLLGDGVTGVIEMAAASGLALLRAEECNPLIATTFGTGELIQAALDAGCRKLIIGVGGSATNDGGAGMAQALGARLLDKKGQPLPWGGAALARLERIDLSGLDPRLRDCDIQVACDVTNPLCGPQGASCIYGPQKGATSEMVAQLDAALRHYAEVLRRDLGQAVAEMPGAGAAGGLAAGLVAFLHARLVPGVELVARAVNLEHHLRGADLVFTGEGRIDGQTVFGKTPVGVARMAKKLNLPVIAIVGELGQDCVVVYEHGIDAMLSIAPGPLTLAQAQKEAEKLVADAAERAMRLLLLGRKLSAL